MKEVGVLVQGNRTISCWIFNTEAFIQLWKSICKGSSPAFLDFMWEIWKCGTLFPPPCPVTAHTQGPSFFVPLTVFFRVSLQYLLLKITCQHESAMCLYLQERDHCGKHLICWNQCKYTQWGRRKAHGPGAWEVSGLFPPAWNGFWAMSSSWSSYSDGLHPLSRGASLRVRHPNFSLMACP